MRYTSTLVAVQSMAVSRPFYENVLGMKVVMDMGENVVLKGGVALQEQYGTLCGFPPEQTQYRAFNGELYFETETLDADAARIKATGAALLHDVKVYPWGQRVLRFFDPDGHLIELGDSMEYVAIGFLKQGMSDEEVCARTQHPMEFLAHCKELMKTLG